MSDAEQLPKPFLERLQKQFDEEVYLRILSGMKSNRYTAFRVNRLLDDVGDPLEELEHEGFPLIRVDYVPGAAILAPEHRQRLLSSAAYVGKRIYVQNLASMLPVIALSPEPGERILDLTAAPGSKTLQIAEAAGHTAEIVAVELNRGRFFKLRANLQAYGASHVRTFLQDGSRLWRHRPEYFDRILLDAPCSSEGRFLVDKPETYAYWSTKKVSEMVRKQKRLLYSAVQALRPGGVIVYATCSLSAEENEGVVSRILHRFADALKTESMDLNVSGISSPMTSWKEKDFHASVRNARRIVPSEIMEGFFLCKLIKLASTVEI